MPMPLDILFVTEKFLIWTISTFERWAQYGVYFACNPVLTQRWLFYIFQNSIANVLLIPLSFLKVALDDVTWMNLSVYYKGCKMYCKIFRALQHHYKHHPATCIFILSPSSCAVMRSYVHKNIFILEISIYYMTMFFSFQWLDYRGLAKCLLL